MSILLVILSLMSALIVVNAQLPVAVNINTGYALRVSSSGKYMVGLNSHPVYGSSNLYVSNNYGSTFTGNAFTAPWNDVRISGNGQYLVATKDTQNSATTGNIYTSSNFGSTWVVSYNAYNDGSSFYATAAISATGQYMSVNCYEGRLYFSSNYGATFAIIGNPAHFGSTITMSGNGQYHLTVGYGDGYYTSSNYGCMGV